MLGWWGGRCLFFSLYLTACLSVRLRICVCCLSLCPALSSLLLSDIACGMTGGDDPVIREAQRNMADNRARWAAERGGATIDSLSLALSLSLSLSLSRARARAYVFAH